MLCGDRVGRERDGRRTEQAPGSEGPSKPRGECGAHPEGNGGQPHTVLQLRWVALPHPEGFGGSKAWESILQIQVLHYKQLTYPNTELSILGEFCIDLDLVSLFLSCMIKSSGEKI